MIQTKEELFLAELGINTKEEIEFAYGAKIKITDLLKKYETKQLLIHIVSQQRELLEAYTQFLWTQHNNLSNAENNEIALNKFIASNCG